jgi:hypothetical protein
MSERENQGGDPEVAVCHLCGKTFATQELMSQHLMDDHAERRDVDPRTDA